MFKRTLKSVEFSFMSDEDVLRQSVMEVTVGKIPNASIELLEGSLYDLKMGTVEKGKNCATCLLDFSSCKGHFGHINLAVPVINPVCTKYVKWVAQHVCRNCKKIIITSDHLKLHKIKNYKISSKYIDKVSCCFHCSSPKEPFDIESELDFLQDALNKIPTEEISILNLKGCHPKDLIMNVFPIIPTCARPYLSNKDDSFDDDLTCQLSEIIKTNNSLKKHLEDEDFKHKVIKDLNLRLNFKIKTYYDNNKKKSKHSASGHSYIGIKGMLGRKQGLIRKYLSGKRSNQGARTVLGGDTTLKIDQVGVPLEVCKVLTTPVRVSSLNYDEVLSLMTNDKVNYLQKGDRRISMKFCKPKLEIGDVAHVQLRYDDWVVVNRQPTLHKPSIMGFRVVPQDVKTFKINLSVTKPFNADFDGDEVNMHVPQNPMAVAEVKELMATPNHILSPKNGKPIICLVQDAIIGMYLMTTRFLKIPDDEFDQCLMDIEDLSRYEHIVSKLGKTGKALFSFLLPRDLHFVNSKVVIRGGLLLSGVADKNILGSSSTSIIKCLFDDYGPQTAGKFIDECQFMANRYMLFAGYSIGISDCVTISRRIVEKIVSDMLPEDIDGFQEDAILYMLNNVKDKIMSMALQLLSENSRFMTSVESGAKGSRFNLCQMTGMLAQQYINGLRLGNKNQNFRQKGFVIGSFGTGLTPEEFFSHAESGRTSLCDTALTTSQTGYSQRRLIKLLEKLIVQGDDSVRCAYTKKKYEVCFGTDGIDPSRRGVDEKWLTRAIYRMIDD